MKRTLLSTTVVLSLFAPCTAQKPLRAADIPVGVEATKTARQFQQLKLSNVQVKKRVRKLHKELTWHKRLDKAVAAAKVSGKPIVWIHALGKLTGYV